MQKNAFYILFLLLFSASLVAQHQEIHTPPHLWKGKKSVAEDSTSLLFAFKHGKVHGNLRYFFMATENQDHLTDAHANAAGGGLFYETASFKGFQFGVGGYFIYNVNSSDMTHIDPYTQVENVFNTSMLQWDMKQGAWVAGLQYTQQQAVNDGGNEDPSKTYFSSDQQSRVISSKLGYESGKWKSSLNYTRITSEGRYLMPREWGRDPFYTFMPRERNEGLGDVNAYVGKVNFTFPKAPLKASVSYGFFQLPDVKNYTLNKYGLPSYTQLNLDLTYEFTDFLEGLEIQALYVHKANQGETYQNEKYIIHKVNMSNFNLILNFHF